MKVGGFLSPAEAQFAYEGGEKENHLPGRTSKQMAHKADSPLDIISEERHLHPLVSPLGPSFIMQSPARATDSAVSGFPGLHLAPLKEHVKETVPIIVELRTNVIVKDEFRLVTELSNLLAGIYFCSQDGIIINVDHSACLMMAASFDPAYMLTITTTPDQLDFDVNNTNTTQIQRLMHQILSVPAHRGLLRFQPILEENVGTAGGTVAHLNHRTPRHLYDARRAVSPGPENEGFGIANGTNPAAPPPALANKVLRQQISSMSEPDCPLTIRDDVSEITAAELSPDVPTTQPGEHRRVQSDMALNFHRPRPISTYSSRFREGSVDWRPTMPTPSSEDQQLSFFPSTTDSEEESMPAPPPIPHSRSESSQTKISRRRSLFAVFRK
ncbi:hypothetical protein CAC42_8143 [Sphaceloma murrayae]|uniref:L-dopachrome isomerase n=1 Tax=Sphaceloma murrayae TaxID=2082308 RepID=A0A2K1QJR7_9PEZI|nr:hypothetical protein CAC42_8143 [Sphaceloma murrayae]